MRNETTKYESTKIELSGNTKKMIDYKALSDIWLLHFVCSRFGALFAHNCKMLTDLAWTKTKIIKMNAEGWPSAFAFRCILLKLLTLVWFDFTFEIEKTERTRIYRSIDI